MTTLSRPIERVGGRATATQALGWLLVGLAVAVVIVAGALLLLLTPLYIHAALASADSAAYLGVTPSEAERLSDATVGEILLGPGTFAFGWSGGERFYDATEVGHLQDVRVVLFDFLGVALVSLAVLAYAIRRSASDAALWRAIRRGSLALSIAFVVVGALFLFAFDPAFELFHRVFFPGGNWSFDPTSQHLVQLYPIPFWQLTSTVLGALAVGAGLICGWLARAQAGHVEHEQADRLERESAGAVR